MEQLLAVYTYLLKKCRVKPQTVHGWWVLGTLLDEIKKTFEQKSPGISSPRAQQTLLWVLYHEPTHRCTFDEFYTASNTASLLPLFISKGLWGFNEAVRKLYRPLLNGTPISHSELYVHYEPDDMTFA
ncbi:hypothetical protein FOMPIDRAFT_85785 [Fomitopsis schrenkii]|uniref:Uncharacterized protein n=1 Tax=Fomitopsis schrenkii TaxID=2126942 RepID=S8FB07_FOMSC|nr:hypothetical protein FOMPIDRAFT_85785 [Fomitopsis schrenkii]